MIQLKDYQQRVLESLRAFLKRTAQTRHPADAFREVTESKGRCFFVTPTEGEFGVIDVKVASKKT